MGLTLVACAVVVLGNAVIWLTSPDRMKFSTPTPYVLGGATVFAVVFICMQYRDQQKQYREQQEDLDTTRKQLAEITDALRASRQELADLKDRTARTEPKLLLLADRTVQAKDGATGLTQTTYFFRSQHPGPLPDVSVELRFDGPCQSAQARITGAFVIDQGSRLALDGDLTGIRYTTGLLKEGNDLVIQVVSKGPLCVVSRRLSP